MKKIIFLFLSIASLGAFAQTEPIAPEYVRTDSIASFTNDTDVTIVGRGTGGVNIEGEYTLPKTDGTANQVFKTDGAGNIVFDNVSFSEIEGTDTVLTISDTVSTLATQYDLTQIQGYTVTNEADNRVITSTGAGTGNAETNLTFDGTDLNIVTGGLQIGGTEVISSGRAITGTTGNLSTLNIASHPSPTGNKLSIFTADGNTDYQISLRDLTSAVTADYRIRANAGDLSLTFDPVSGSNHTAKFTNSGAGVFNMEVDGSLTAGATTVSSFTNSGVAGTGERLKTATSTGLESTIANGTDGQVMTMVSGSPAWANNEGTPINGTYTPAITASSSNPTVSYTTQDGNFQKIGDYIHVWIFIHINTISGGSGDYRINLPEDVIDHAAIGNTYMRAVTWSSNVETAAYTDDAQVDGSGNYYLTIDTFSSGSTIKQSLSTSLNSLTNGSRIWIKISYKFQ